MLLYVWAISEINDLDELVEGFVKDTALTILTRYEQALIGFRACPGRTQIPNHVSRLKSDWLGMQQRIWHTHVIWISRRRSHLGTLQVCRRSLTLKRRPRSEYFHFIGCGGSLSLPQFNVEVANNLVNAYSLHDHDYRLRPRLLDITNPQIHLKQ